MQEPNVPPVACVVGCLAAVAIIGCSDNAPALTSPANGEISTAMHLAVPELIATVATAAGTVELWPYTGEQFNGTPHDPINLIFTGEKDPRLLRGALLSLDGNRTAFGFPAEFPFNCRWTDAVGGVQTAFSSEAKWQGSAIQLECGAFGPLRFHLRLFDAGSHTIANAHFEVLIEGTTTHEVLSWKLAQQFVTVDFIRSGLLGAPPDNSGPLHPAPTYRTIRTEVYNQLPPSLREVAEGPADNVSEPVGIPNSGVATLLHLAESVPIEPEVTRRRFTVQFGQVVPKPFCATGPLDYVHVSGPVEFAQDVTVTPSGVYTARVKAQGELAVLPFDVITMTPSGPMTSGQVSEHYQSNVAGAVAIASVRRTQTIFPVDGEGGGRLKESLVVGPGHSSRYDREVRCGE